MGREVGVWTWPIGEREGGGGGGRREEGWRGERAAGVWGFES